MREFHCKTRIVSGEGALDWLNGRSCRQLLMVADPYFYQNGWAEKIANRVVAEKRDFFTNVKPDPTVELAAEGTALMRQMKPDLLIALGGGSAMDTAKAMMYFAGEKVMFVAIPTTSGSGSEVTDFSVLTHGDVKHPLVDKRLQPDVAIVDGELVEKLPPALVADGGFDALCHALESFVATGADPMTRALAGSAFAIAFENLAASYRGDLRARKQMHLASTMAGLAFSQSGLGLCHALAHSLGGVLHLPHGRLNAVLLPEVIGCNSTCAPQYAQLARLAGIGGSADAMGMRNLRNSLVRLRKELNLPATLREAGADMGILRKNREKILETAQKDPCMATNPVQVDAHRLGSILEAVSGCG